MKQDKTFEVQYYDGVGVPWQYGCVLNHTYTPYECLKPYTATTQFYKLKR